jgi:hypothetical protein
VSYLDPPRLIFSGFFHAAISTVNNDPLHFDNATFEPSYQDVQAGNDPSQWNGWFNPRGNGDWQLIDCTVKSAVLADGSPAAADDPALAAIVADSDRAAPAKLVDLDPEQQLVSMIWGLEIRIATSAGETLVGGQFEPAAFIDIWDRGQGPGTPGDINAGAMYQSVLSGLRWSAVESPFLRQLREAAAGGVLSVKFNVDGVNLDPNSPRFLQGRIVGTIGASAPGEPHHFVQGRQFMATFGAGGNFFAPAGNVNFCAGVVDRQAGRIYVDLGNALPTAEPGGQLANLGDISLYQIPPPDPAGAPLLVGSLSADSYTQPAWYQGTAGIAVFPPDRALTAEELDRVDSNPLALVVTPPGGSPALAIEESPGGVFVRADQFVFRLNPGEEVTAQLYATRYGHPYPGAAVITVPVPGQLQPFSPLGPAPAAATPADAIRYDTRAVTDAHGMARLRIQALDPGQPRGYIDGQVYGIYPALEETVISPANPYPYNQWNFVSLLVWSGFEPDEPPTWFGSIQPVLQQYANLYPVMQRFLDLGNYESVCAHIPLLALAFGLNPSDPNSMPVTRDLSAAKRSAILRWLISTGEDGKPLMGSAGQLNARMIQPAAASPGSPAAGPSHVTPPSLGGKASAASRRLVAQRRSAAQSLEQLMTGDGHDPAPS